MARLNLPARVAVAFVLAAVAALSTTTPIVAQRWFGNLMLWDGKGNGGNGSHFTEPVVIGGELYALIVAKRYGTGWSFWDPKHYPHLRPVVGLRVVGVHALDTRACVKAGGSWLVWNRTVDPSSLPWGSIPTSGEFWWLDLKSWMLTQATGEQESKWYLQFCGEPKCWTQCQPPDPPEFVVVLCKVEILG